MSKRRTSLFAADKIAGAKSSFLLFAGYSRREPNSYGFV